MSEPEGIAFAANQMEFVKVSSKKVEILLYKLRMAETSLWQENG